MSGLKGKAVKVYKLTEKGKQAKERFDARIGEQRRQGVIMTTPVRCQCEVCGYIVKVGFTAALRTGWPVCHGWTMTLIDSPTAAEVNEAVQTIVGIAPK